MGSSDGAAVGVSPHAPAFEGDNDVARALERALELCDIEDPVSEPFRSKYKARDELKKVKHRLETGVSTVSLGRGGDDYVPAGGEAGAMVGVLRRAHYADICFFT